MKKKEVKYSCRKKFGKKIFWNFSPKNIFGRGRIIHPPPRENKEFLVHEEGGGELFGKFGYTVFFQNRKYPLFFWLLTAPSPPQRMGVSQNICPTFASFLFRWATFNMGHSLRAPRPHSPPFLRDRNLWD